MADDVDTANDYAEAERERSVSIMLARIGKGRTTCFLCGEPISELRQACGAQKCMDCQEEHERRNR